MTPMLGLLRERTRLLAGAALVLALVGCDKAPRCMRKHLNRARCCSC